MNDNRQSAQDYFRALLLTVAGQAFGAAGYALDDNPIRTMGGMIRWQKPLTDDLWGFIDYQVLIYTPNAYASESSSRFRVSLTRTPFNVPKPNKHPSYFHSTLSQLVVGDFGVNILPNVDHWWTFNDTTSLGKTLAESGYLVVGYGIPFLEGDLLPPQ